MKLVFYGGGREGHCSELDKAAIKMTDKKKPSITYIPSCSYWGETDFKDYVRGFQKYGIERFVLLEIDIPFDKTFLGTALQSDIIHLSGGNTYYFLKYLRKSRMLQQLKKFVQRGGVLTGLSAGGIIMTPNIESASYPSFERDINEENIKNLYSLNLVKFEFCPHYRSFPRFDREILKRSKKINHPIYASPDEKGLIINGQTITFVGQNYCFYNGQKINIFG